MKNALTKDLLLYSLVAVFLVAAGDLVPAASATTSAQRTAAPVSQVDVLLVTTTLLDRTPEFDYYLGRYQMSLPRTEGLVAEYVEVDSDSCFNRYGTKVTNPYNWYEIRNVLDHISGVNGASYFILLGGINVVPRPTAYITNQVPSAAFVASDGWYADFDDDQIVDASYSVGRFCDLNDGSSAVAENLKHAVFLHNAGGITLDKKVQFSLGHYTTPPYGVCVSCSKRSETFDLLSSSDYIVFAGHGDRFGFYTDARQHIFTISYMDSINLRTFHPLVLGFYSCETGQVHGSTPTLSYELPKAGASAFVARTTTEGVPTHVVNNFESSLLSGERIGPALFRLMRETVLFYGDGFKTAAGHLTLCGDPTLARRTTTAIDENRVVSISLVQNYPNPFNPSTTIDYLTTDAGNVSLIVYDVTGRLVRTLVNENMAAGDYEVKWDGTDVSGNPVSSGVYFYRLNAGKTVLTRKMVLLK